ncbi:hypothetical protein [Hyphobacterium sp.]|uniref:hypothetical protein n=1 Tax=Hyphobacterium sp. TaxID=2004662 RepID=UPI003BAAE9D9
MDHNAAFAELKNLVGSWKGTNEEGDPVEVAFSVTANGSAVVEDWTFHNGMTALTVYSLDEDTLQARHYCPIGNQPLLELKGRDNQGALVFEFVSARNLPDPKTDHNRAFDIRMTGKDEMIRNETYRENFVSESNGTRFSRV